MRKLILLVVTAFLVSSGVARANDWRVEILKKLDNAIAQTEAARKFYSSTQTNADIGGACDRAWILIESHQKSYEPDLRFMIAVDKIQGHDYLKARLGSIMSEGDYDKEVNKITKLITALTDLCSIDQAKLASKK